MLPILAASVVGSLHCAAMCGGLVAVAEARPPGTRQPAWLGPLAFHAGRLLVYLGLGGMAGAVGTALDLASRRAGVGDVATVVAGLVMVAFGLTKLLAYGGVAIPRFGRLQRLTELGLLACGRLGSGSARAFVLGLSTGLLPCGWLYAFVASAAATANPVWGMAIMGAFFLGTVPALLGVGLLTRRIVGRFEHHLPLLTAAILVGLGMTSILNRSNLAANALQSLTEPDRVHTIQARCH